MQSCLVKRNFGEFSSDKINIPKSYYSTAQLNNTVCQRNLFNESENLLTIDEEISKSD
jgi:hypothetical protein